MVSNVPRELMASRNKLNGTEHKALVVNNNDPDKNQRLQVRVRDVHLNIPDNILPWARKKDVQGGLAADVGHVDIPPIGATVMVTFEDDSQYHLTWGPAHSTTDVGGENILPNYPHTRGRADYAGHKIYVDHGTNANSGSITIDSVWGHVINITPGGIQIFSNGTIDQESKGDMTFKSGGKITMSSAGDMALKSGGTASLNGAGDANLLAGGTAHVNGASVQIKAGPSPAAPDAPGALTAGTRPTIADPSNMTDY